MPAERYWEFEDGEVNFAGAEAGVTDLLRMTRDRVRAHVRQRLVPGARAAAGRLAPSRRRLRDHRQLRRRRAANADRRTRRHAMDAVLADARRDPARTSRARACSCPTASTACRKERCWRRRCSRATRWPTWRGRSSSTVQGVSGEPLDRDLEAQALAFQQRIAFEAASTARSSSTGCRRRCRRTGRRCCRCATRRSTSADPLTIRLARAGMKRFYPEASVAVIGAVDPDVCGFPRAPRRTGRLRRRGCRSAMVCAPTYSIRAAGCCAVIRTQPMLDDDTLLIEEEEVPRIGAHAQAQVPVRALERRPELAVDRPQQDRRAR